MKTILSDLISEIVIEKKAAFEKLFEEKE